MMPVIGADIDALARTVSELVEPSDIDTRSLWDRLSSSTGDRVPGSGHPSAKSRPPATLSVVALVIDVTAACREGADDLAGHAHPGVPSNLYAIVDALNKRPNDDLIEWWCDAVREWSERARYLVGQTHRMSVQLHGACCPYCGATTISIRQNAETWSVPAITVDYDESQTVAEYAVHRVECRACKTQWLRGDELDSLINDVIARNYSTNV